MRKDGPITAGAFGHRRYPFVWECPRISDRENGLRGRRHDRLGGGYHAPRHKAIISETEVWCGHILVNYSIVFEDLPLWSWEHSVRTAADPIRAAFLGGNVFAHLDRKSFKAWQRQAYPLLSEMDVPVRRGKEISPVIVKSLVQLWGRGNSEELLWHSCHSHHACRRMGGKEVHGRRDP